MSEILTNILQEVTTGKLTTIENVIGKLRVDFEDNNLFKNKNKKFVILLNFEDDTMRPVLKIEDKYMDIIQKWYHDSNLVFDIENTNVFIPEIITIQDISGVLFKDFNCNHKYELLNSYIPLVINNIISDINIKSFEKKFKKSESMEYNVQKKMEYNIQKKMDYFNLNQNNSFSQTTLQQTIDSNNIISNIGIIIPDNIISSKISPIPNQIISNVDILMSDNIISHTSNPQTPIDNVFPYNMEYNVLYPSFSDRYFIIDDDKNKEIQTNTSIYVLLNDKFFQTITILNPSVDILYVIKNHPEFGFIKLFEISTNNTEIIKFIEHEFCKVCFNDIEEINKKLSLTSQYIEFSNKHNNVNTISSNEEQSVKTFFNMYYIINDNIEHKLKASTLYDYIVNSNLITIDKNTISGFRNRLSKYLNNIGLKKKRYNDGFYYYGIVKKDILKVFKDIKLQEIEKEINSYNCN